MINAQPARDKVIDTLNSVWFDYLLLSAEIWGRADSFCVGQKWPLTSLCEMWRLLLDTWGFLELSQLAHVNWRNPRLLKWKTDLEDYLKAQSRRLWSFSLVCLVFGYSIDCSLVFHFCPVICCCSLRLCTPPSSPVSTRRLYPHALCKNDLTLKAMKFLRWL